MWQNRPFWVKSILRQLVIFQVVSIVEFSSLKVMVTNVTSLLKTVKAVEDEATKGTRALESTIEHIRQELAVSKVLIKKQTTPCLNGPLIFCPSIHWWKSILAEHEHNLKSVRQSSDGVTAPSVTRQSGVAEPQQMNGVEWWFFLCTCGKLVKQSKIVTQ